MTSNSLLVGNRGDRGGNPDHLEKRAGAPAAAARPEPLETQAADADGRRMVTAESDWRVGKPASDGDEYDQTRQDEEEQEDEPHTISDDAGAVEFPSVLADAAERRSRSCRRIFFCRP
jgi:hypothetical protein